MKKRVVLAMSGGVDSSVAALVLKNQGYEVIGLFMNNWQEDEDGVCCASSDWEDVRSVCARLDLPCFSVSFYQEYRDRVFEHFLSEYRQNRTPNPDVLCNREIKFGAFWDYARKLGADYIATGHYCALRNGLLFEAEDKNKDQTYFLNQVKTEQLENVLFPLGGIKKEKVRALAEEYNLTTARKKDSTGICFIGERDFKEFLSLYIPANRGEITDKDGNVLGYHDGLMYYTLGQRRGLDVGGKKGYANDRWYVIDKDVKNNRLIISCGEGGELLSREVICQQLNIIGGYDTDAPFMCRAKPRYRHGGADARFTYLGDGRFKVLFTCPQRAVTPGQYMVIYEGERCLGGGVIVSAEQ